MMRPVDVNLEENIFVMFIPFLDSTEALVCPDQSPAGEVLLVWELLSSCTVRGVEWAQQWGISQCWQTVCSQGLPREALIKAFCLGPVSAHRLRLQLTCNTNIDILKPPVRVH